MRRRTKSKPAAPAKGVAAPSATSGYIATPTHDDMNDVHAALRRVLVAFSECDRARAEYVASPTDNAALEFVGRWREWRAASNRVVELNTPTPYSMSWRYAGRALESVTLSVEK